MQKDTLEQWNIINLTGDTHPMHVHLANFQILDRQNLNATQYMNAMTANGTRIWQSAMADALGVLAQVPDTTLNAVPDPAPYLIGSAIPPAAGEMGWKDTIHVPPGQVTRLLVPFGNDALGTAGTTGTDDIPFGRLVTEGAGIAYGSFGGSFTGTYVWHCHILDHEENDMMNFYQIV